MRLLGLSAVFLSSVPLLAQTDLEKGKPDDPELWLLHKVIQRAVRSVRPSIVMIETFGGVRKSVAGKPRPGQPARPRPPKDDKKDDKKKPIGPLRMPGFLTAQGPSTGLVISKDGWIATSRFALSWDPSTILVTLDDGRKFTAERFGEDRTRGLSLLKIDADDLPVPRFLPAGQIEVGQWAFAVARSFGQQHPTVHVGMVSAVDRIQRRAVQTDASASPANYGGPLIDLEGRVLGLVVPLSPKGDVAGADWYDSGIGFAATLTGIDDKIAAMKEGKVFEKAFLGVAMDPAHLGPGARVLSTTKKTAANHANIRKGDMILEIGGEPVRHSTHLQDLIGYHVAGDWVEISLQRKSDGAVSRILVELGKR